MITPTDTSTNVNMSSCLYYPAFQMCLTQEVKFLEVNDMLLLIDPKEIFEGDNNEIWVDSMAYLVEPKGKNTHLDNVIPNKNGHKPILKCGFVTTG
jgi:hypothetical protein